jgi:DNA (cytosine-5)-methyltransferase 1
MGAGKSVDAWDEWTARMQAKHGNGNGHGASLSVEALRLLPTPIASSGGHMPPSAVQLLPTPRVKNNENRQSEGYGGEDGNFYGLLHNPERWGIYAPAIARWEPIIGRPAPDPTEPTGKGGAHRLAPRFVEFMQGLPAGHVTDPAIWHGWKPGAARYAQLKALGNGVVPQQAATAIRHLLGVRERYTTMGAGSNGSRPRWATRTVL